MGWSEEKTWRSEWIGNAKEKINGIEIEWVKSIVTAEKSRKKKRGNRIEHKKKKSWALKTAANREGNAEKVWILERKVEDVPKDGK